MGKALIKVHYTVAIDFIKPFLRLLPHCGNNLKPLSLGHIIALIQVEDPVARDWYAAEATKQTWIVRTLQRNVSSQYYYRLLQTQKKELVETEMKELTSGYQNEQVRIY